MPTVKLWTIQGGELTTLTGHQAAVYDVSFSPDGQSLATASGDTQVKLWSLQGKLLKTLQGHGRAVYDLSFSGDGQSLATTSGDRTVKVWSVRDPVQATLQKTLAGHRGAVYAAEFGPQGQSLATAANDETIAHLWTLPRFLCCCEAYRGPAGDQPKPESRWAIRADRIRKWSAAALRSSRPAVANPAASTRGDDEFNL